MSAQGISEVAVSIKRTNALGSEGKTSRGVGTAPGSRWGSGAAGQAGSSAL